MAHKTLRVKITNILATELRTGGKYRIVVVVQSSISILHMMWFKVVPFPKCALGSL